MLHEGEVGPVICHVSEGYETCKKPDSRHHGDLRHSESEHGGSCLVSTSAYHERDRPRPGFSCQNLIPAASHLQRPASSGPVRVLDTSPRGRKPSPWRSASLRDALGLPSLTYGLDHNASELCSIPDVLRVPASC